MQQPVSFPISGGLDLVTPPLAKPPGRAIAALNYEPVATGYRRLKGFERFDGRTAPSSSGDPSTIATLRAAITAVPGSGPVRCVMPVTRYNGTQQIWAIRDNAGGTAAVIHNATVSGWSTQTIAKKVSFDQGGIDGVQLSSDPSIFYDNVSGAGVGAGTFPIGRFIVTSGSWAGGDAAGFLWTSSNTPWASGDYVYETGASTLRVCRLTGTPTAPTIPAGGSYSAIRHNFFGASKRIKTYLANGVGKALEVGDDGILTVIAEIATGMTTDTPTKVAEHRNSLFLAFPGGSVQFSTVGEPLDFSPITGAGELTIGSAVTNLAPLPNALAILGEKSIHVLYGSDSSDYQLEGLNEEAGALEHTAQNFGNLIYMDNRGLRSLAAAQRFGNFTTGTLSRLIAPLLEDKRRDGVDPSASLVCRTADQYWLFFDDGTGVIVYMGGKEPWILPFNLGVTVTCTASVENDGVERLFIGCSNGFVYELNKGTSFDGSAIEHYVALAYNNMGSPQLEKRIHKALIDVEASGTTTISAAARFNLGSIDGPDAQVVTLTTGGAAIDDLGTGESYYSALTPAVGEVYFDGVFRDISLKISGSQASQEQHTLTGVTYLVSPRGLRR